jgi:tRNA uridine 5-carbamoylmethylation protein Kti12
MSLIKEWTFGTHSARWEEPDLLRLTWKGPTRVEDVDKVLAILAEVAAERPIFVISDVSRSTIDKAAREHMSQSLRAEWFHGLIYVGADALQRAITKAIVIALYFTGKWRVDVEFAATEEEAMHIVSRVRRARGADAPARTENVSMGLQGPQALA